MKLRSTRVAVAAFLSCSTVFAGTYGPQNFNSFAVDAVALGDGSTMGNTLGGVYTSIQNRPGSGTDRGLRLTQDGVQGDYGAFKLGIMDAGQEVSAFDASFKLRQYSPDTLADGCSFNFGAIPGGTDYGAGETGFTMPNGLIISFDTYANFAGDAPRIKVLGNGIQVGIATVAFNTGDNTFHNVVIHWDAIGGLDMTYDGTAIFTDLAVTGFAPAVNNTFGFSARTGGSDQDTMIDDLQLATTPVAPLTTSDVVITEFLADNGDGIEDEDADTSDWIEVYNGTPAPVDLAGWRLTNVAGNLGLWTFPSVTLVPFSYLRVFASGKNRVNPAGVLHTSFTLDKAGGYLALVKPDGSTKTSEFTFGAQSEDVSFGTYGAAQTPQYLVPPTPAAKNEVLTVLHADGPPAEEVVFSRDGGLITAAVPLGVTAPLGAGAVIRYTEDGTVPDGADPVFNPAAPLTISTSKTIRARVFQPARLPGDLSSRSFLLLDASLTSFGNTGQPFSSNLPIVVVESWGTNIDAVTNPAGLRPYRPTYTVVLGKDPLNGNRAKLDGLVNFQGRGGMHVRGQTSSGFGQKPYAWEVWTNEDEDKSVSLLGMPADSDWVLQTPYNDKSLMRNSLPYTLMQETNGASGAVRTQFVEVFFNQDSGPVSYADYRGVYVLMERIKRGSDRIDIAKLSPLSTDPAVISGGYIFKKDKLPVAPLYTTTSTSAWGGQTHEITEPEDANAAQLAALQTYVQQFDNALSGANFADPATGYKAFIEPQTFMDNQLWVETFKQIDGYRLSTYFTKDRGQKIRAFPIWDYNLSGGNANYLTGDQTAGWYYSQLGAPDYPYYSRLFQDADFQIKYWDRYWQLRRSRFATANIHAKIDGWANDLTDNNYATSVVNGALIFTGFGDFFPTDKANNLPPSLESTPRVENAAMRHFDRWPILGIQVWPNPAGVESRTTFQSEVQWMKDWFTARLSWIDGQNLRPPDFSSPGGNVPSGTPLTITNPNGSGTIYYTSDGSDPYLPAASAEVTFVAGSSAACQWLVPSAGNGGNSLTAGAGASQWTTYTDPPNIANWTTGTTGIGYDRNIVAPAVNYLPHLGTSANTESLMYNINQTCYLRVSFNIPNQAALNAVGTLLLGMKYDDGFRAYLNGTVVGGRNDTSPTMASNPQSAQASAGHDDNAAIVFESIDITALGKPALRIGQNTLAIHCLNSGLTSSDLLISPRLTYLPTFTPSPTAQPYPGTLTLLSTATVRSRVLVGGQWSPITEASFVVNANPASAGNIVVSEFCPNPTASGIYTSKDLEFIVLRNISAGNVDLTGVQLTSGVAHALTGTPQQLTLAPGGEAVIAADPTALQAIHGAPPGGVVVFGPFAGALDNNGEILGIRTAANTVIKEFAYSDLPPWPVSAGYSLVLEHPATNPSHADGHNWRSSVAVRGTPYSSDSAAFTGSWPTDSDFDGFADGAEYALGTNPNNPGSVPLVAVATANETVGLVTGRFLRLSFRRSLANDEGTILPELSSDLISWQTGTAAFNRIGFIHHGDGNCTETWRSINPIVTPKAFARLKLIAP